MIKTNLCLLIIIGFFLFSQNVFSQDISKKNLTEKEKIEYLLTSIENLKDAKFNRNGTFYDSKSAADHMRMKLNKAGSHIKTAKDFINKIGSESYLTGIPYKIKFADGQEVLSKQFLLNKLKEME